MGYPKACAPVHWGLTQLVLPVALVLGAASPGSRCCRAGSSGGQGGREGHVSGPPLWPTNSHLLPTCRLECIGPYCPFSWGTSHTGLGPTLTISQHSPECIWPQGGAFSYPTLHRLVG